MSTYPIKDTIQSNDRHKLYTLMCNTDKISEGISYLLSQEINVINIGKELATYIEGVDDYKYLSIDVYDYTKKLLDKHKAKINGNGNDVLAIFNLGILLEPRLELNAVQLLKEFSKSTALIIIWENQSDIPGRLNWLTVKNNLFFDFTDLQIKKLHYAI